MVTLALYLFFGVLTGILAGLLGVGGGIIVVPILDFALPMQEIPSHLIHHMALGTSMASIMFTSISSARAHNQRGTILWDVVKTITPGILAGTFIGTFFVANIPAKPLKLLFACFLFYTSIQMALDLKPRASFHLPGKWLLMLVGAGIGGFSSFVGIGGGSLTIPFLVLCNLNVMNVIGISAAVGFPIALAGTIGYICNGYALPDLPEYSLGFVYLPALAGLVCASMLTAPIGVKLSHSLPVKTIKRFFGVFLCLMGIRMVYSIYF